MASPTRPIMIAGRTDIARVYFEDGTSMAFPSIASVTSASSMSTSPSTFRSRSSSQQRGRRGHASSFSSTGSVRDSFGMMSMPCISDAGTTDPDSTMTAVPSSTVDGFTPSISDLDHVDVGEDWGTATLKPADFWATDSSFISATHNQDHLVAQAHGAHNDLPQQYIDFPKTLDDISIPRRALSNEEVSLHNVNAMQPFSSASAPAATSWMGHASRDSSSPASPMMTIKEGRETPARVTGKTSSTKITRRPGRALGSKLSEAKRRKVAIMRKVRACQYCKDGRRGCDTGTPCKPCILHFGAEVLDEPNHCRKDIVEHLSSQILSKACKWHPYPREMTDFFGRDFYVTAWTVEIPVLFGFGPPLPCAVSVLQTTTPSLLQHEHVQYPTRLATKPEPSYDYVLPVTFCGLDRLHYAVDRHLSMLVDEHFRHFNAYSSRFCTLGKIHQLYMHYRGTSHEYATLLHQVLKLLVLVHHAEITVPTQDNAVANILKHLAPGYVRGQPVTPCILRAELGSIAPEMARLLLQDVLKKLLRLTLARRCEQHPVVIACFSVLMMIIESIMYHSSRIGYHAHTNLTVHGGRRDSSNVFNSISNPIEASGALEMLESAARDLQTIYKNCFENCHALLLRIIEERHFTSLQKQFGESPACFIAALNQAIREAGGYLEMKVSEKLDSGSNSSLVFDRLLARLFLLQTGPYMPPNN